MNFTTTKDQADFAATVRALISSTDAPGLSRAWADGETESGTRLWRRLGDVGVHSLMVSETQSGFAESPVELVLAFTEIGRGGIPGPYIESAAFLPALLAGTDSTAVASLIEDTSAIATVASPPKVPFAVDASTA